MGESDKNSTQARRIVFLDYLRIFAFLSVLIGHKFYGHAVSFVNNEAAHSTPRLIVELLLPLFYGGGAGVVVFFLISGYIITFVLQTEQPTEFIIKRFFRIYPLYITAVLLQTIMQSLSSGELPELSIILPQLLLIGDLFGTPYTLGGVEWTLRLEMLFYAFMVVLRYLGLHHEHKRYFPLLLIITCLTLWGLSPIPSFDTWSKGYVTIYGSFLLLGSIFFLREAKQVGPWFLVGATALVLTQYYYLMGIYQPKWIDAHFATLGVLIFFLSWAYRSAFTVTPFILLLSDLTYSVYIFHNWAWDPIKTVFHKLSIVIFHSDIQALFALFLLCFFMVNIVEKPCIRLGKKMIRHIIKSA